MRTRKRGLVQSLLLCVVLTIELMSSVGANLQAAVIAEQETRMMLLDPVVGRYQINYTGNTNHYAFWTSDPNPADKVPRGNVVYNDVPGSYTNSSTATLSKGTGADKIVKAFLVWETRASQGAKNPVKLLTPNGGDHNIFPDRAINDWRDLGSVAYQTMYCMATDVTSIVKNSGYGNYSVCNIPSWTPSWADNGGGESPGSWQLIVIEEGHELPVRVASLMMGSEFRADFVPDGKDYSSTLTFGSGLKSKTAGNATGQFFFGASNSSSNAPMTESITSYNDSGGVIGTVNSNTTSSPGLYRNGTLVNNRDYNNGCIRMDLSDVGNVGNSASRIQLDVVNNDWSSFFFLGAAVDVAYPDFIGSQVTDANSSTSVTVSGSFTNTAITPNTGIYDGRMVVELDSGLNATSATAVVNGVTTINGTISGNTVIFDGPEVASMMNGSSISYTVQCSTGNSGKTIFQNRAGFHGNLRADAYNTGYWIDRMWMAESSTVPKYKLTVNAGTGVESVTGGGEYPYGSSVHVGAVLKPGYHWNGWIGDYSTATKDFTLSIPEKDLNMTAEGEANAYTIVFDPNGGGVATPIQDITTQYDMDVTLPDGAGAYVKYTMDGANLTQDVLSGKLPLTSETDVGTPDEAAAGEALNDDIGALGETEADISTSSETLGGTPRPSQNAYPSVFMGWALADGKDAFVPQWRAGDVIRNLTDQDNGVVTLYAVWDDCPWIQAEDLYYTLEQAQSGFITDQEILSHATATDREDGSPIAPGFHENGTSFSIPDYSPTDFTQFQHEGSITENLTVVDSVGSVYSKQITVHVVDTTAVAIKPEGTTRFINEYYYNQPYELGGLENNSVWKTNPEYRNALLTAFKNSRNNTPIETYYFTHDTILKMQEFVDQNGIGNIRSEDALKRFYDQFMMPNKVQ